MTPFSICIQILSIGENRPIQSFAAPNAANSAPFAKKSRENRSPDSQVGMRPHNSVHKGEATYQYSDDCRYCCRDTSHHRSLTNCLLASFPFINKNGFCVVSTDDSYSASAMANVLR